MWTTKKFPDFIVIVNRQNFIILKYNNTFSFSDQFLKYSTFQSNHEEQTPVEQGFFFSEHLS